MICYYMLLLKILYTLYNITSSSWSTGLALGTFLISLIFLNILWGY